MAPGNMPGPMLNPSAASPQAFGYGLGQAIQQSAGGALAKVYQEEQEKADNIALTDAISQAYNRETYYRYNDGKDGKLPGVAVMEGDQLFSNASKVAQNFNNELNGISENLTPNQRLRFTQATQSIRHGFESTTAVRIAQERHRRSIQVTDNALEGINNNLQLRAAKDPKSLTPEALQEAAVVADMTMRQGLNSMPSPPPKDVLDRSAREARYKAIDPVIEIYLREEKFSELNAILKDTNLDDSISPKMRARAMEIVKEGNERQGAIQFATDIYQEAITESKKDYNQGQPPEKLELGIYKYSKERINSALAGEENAKKRRAALGEIDRIFEDDLRVSKMERSQTTEEFANSLLKGAPIASIINDSRYPGLTLSQKMQLGSIEASRGAPNTAAENDRLSRIKGFWTSIETDAPDNVKEALAGWRGIVSSEVPNVESLLSRIGNPVLMRDREWIVASHLVPQLADAAKGVQLSDKDKQEIQKQLVYMWPSGQKDRELLNGVQENLRKEIASGQSKWDINFDRLAEKVSQDYVDSIYLDKKPFEKKALAAELAKDLRLSKSTQAEDKNVPYTEEQMQRLASDLSVNKATKGSGFFSKQYTIDQILDLEPSSQEYKDIQKEGRIPYDTMQPSFVRQAREYVKAIRPGKPVEKKDIEAAAFTLWLRQKSAARSGQIFRP